MISLNWGSFHCSYLNEVGVPTNGSACSRTLVLVIGSLFNMVTYSSFSPIPSLGAEACGFLDNPSALMFVFPER